MSVISGVPLQIAGQRPTANTHTHTQCTHAVHAYLLCVLLSSLPMNSFPLMLTYTESDIGIENKMGVSEENCNV